MLMASDLSLRLGLIDAAVHSRTHRLLSSAGLPIAVSANAHAVKELGAAAYADKVKNLTAEVFLDLMSMDKKVADGRLSLVLLEGPQLGKAIVTEQYDYARLKEVVEEYCNPIH
jgi:3-dehydroquinate synthase